VEGEEPIETGRGPPDYFRDYRVEYRPSGGTWQVAATLSSRTTTSYTVSGLQSDTTYDFRVWVANLFSRKVASNVRTATTDACEGGGGRRRSPQPINYTGPGS
jgi:hypothetical protein